MPDVLPNIPQEPAQGIQAQLDLVYLFNADAANAVIDAANKVIEEIEKGGLGLIKPYSSLVAPVKQYVPTFYNDGLYIANEDISELPESFTPEQWTLIATKIDPEEIDSKIQAEEDARIAEDAILQGNIDAEAQVRAGADAALGNRITTEQNARESADNDLQSQIDAISASSDVKDIVGTYAELEQYDTSTLSNNDIIKVLQDETQDDATSYYRWILEDAQFELIGTEGPYYTRAQTDTRLATKQNTLTAGPGITIENDIISSTTAGDFIPQYDTMPTATASNVGEIAQYSGESIEDSYQNGYFYVSQPAYTDPSATISQTIGSGLTDLSVDVDKFVEAEQPTQSGNTSFVSSGKSFRLNTTEGTTSGITITVDEDVFFAKVQEMWSGIDIGNAEIVNIGPVYDEGIGFVTCSVDIYISGIQSITALSSNDLGDWGITLSGETTEYNTYLWTSFGPVSLYDQWSKNGTTVDLTDYGISYSGTPVDGDELTVAYTAPVIAGYAWNQINVQPAAEATGIEWKTTVDLPAEYYGDPYSAAPYYTIAGGLPDGEYEFYFSTKTQTDIDRPIGEVIFKVRIKIDNTNNAYGGIMGYVFNGNYTNDANNIFGDNDIYLDLVFKNNSDLILFSISRPFSSAILAYNGHEAVPECFKLSAIKNVESGQEYIAVGNINLDGSYPQYTTQMSGDVYLNSIVQPQYIPPVAEVTYYVASELATKTFYLRKEIVSGSVHVEAGDSELIINYTGCDKHGNVTPYSQEIVKATGIFADCYLAYGTTFIYVMGVDTATAATMSGMVYVAVDALSLSGAGVWFDSIPTKPVTTLAQVGPQGYRLGTITADGIGNIIQYTGATDSSYTNGYYYKATGTVVTTPESITTTVTNPAGEATVTIDATNLIDSLVRNIGWARVDVQRWFQEFAASEWNIRYDIDNNTVTAVRLPWAGDYTDSFVTQWFSVTYTGAYTGEMYIYYNEAYTPESKSVQNPSWERVDVQPSSGGGGNFVPQYSTMPQASSSNEGEIVQYIGSTDNDYTNGYFYKCTSSQDVSGATASPSSVSGITITCPAEGIKEIMNELVGYTQYSVTDIAVIEMRVMGVGDPYVFTAYADAERLDNIGREGFSEFQLEEYGFDAQELSQLEVYETIEITPIWETVYGWVQSKTQPDELPSATTTTSGYLYRYVDGRLVWDDTPLTNNSRNGLAVGAGCSTSDNGSVAVGNSCQVYTNPNSIVIGTQTYANGGYGIAIGYYARSSARHAIQIGTTAPTLYNGATNSDANTFKVANANGNFEIMSADGTIPTARLTKVNTTVTLTAAGWSNNTQTVNVTGMTATGVVLVSPDPSDQADYTSAGILCTAQATETLTFTCTNVPTSDIVVSVVML